MRMFSPSALEEDTTPLVMTLNFALAKHEFTEEPHAQMLSMNGWPTESFYTTCCVSTQLPESSQAAVFKFDMAVCCLVGMTAPSFLPIMVTPKLHAA